MNIYVEKFDVQLSSQDLENLFRPFGDVQSAAIEMDVFTNRSRGFGYVEMPDEEQANAAIAALNQSDVNGFQITVKEALPKEVKKGSYKVGSGGINPYRFRKN